MHFELDKDQQQKFEAWQLELDKQLEAQGKPTYGDAIGARFTFSFTPTGLGMIVKAHDGLTRQDIDLTDYDCW